MADLTGAVGVLLRRHSGGSFVENGGIGGDGNRLGLFSIIDSLPYSMEQAAGGRKKGVAVMSRQREDRRAEESLRNEVALTWNRNGSTG